MKQNKQIKQMSGAVMVYNLRLPCYYTDTIVANGLKCDSMHDAREAVYFELKARKVLFVLPWTHMSKKQREFIKL